MTSCWVLRLFFSLISPSDRELVINSFKNEYCSQAWRDLWMCDRLVQSREPLSLPSHILSLAGLDEGNPVLQNHEWHAWCVFFYIRQTHVLGKFETFLRDWILNGIFGKILHEHIRFLRACCNAFWDLLFRKSNRGCTCRKRDMWRSQLL